MRRSRIALASLLGYAAAAAGLAGCAGPHPYVREGDNDSVQIGYAGDVATAWPLARAHCARYERVPQLVDTGLDVAIFDCVKQ
jgi:hypothetical protein